MLLFVPVPNLLFIDANIWLDFYRVWNDTGLRLLEHTEKISDRLIVTYQLENEFKKNRQPAILEGMQQLKPSPQISRPDICSDAKATQMAKNVKEGERRVANLKNRLVKALKNPAVHDPVYKTCQRILHKEDDLDDLALVRGNRLKHTIRRSAFRRFLHGCPSRNNTDTSFGDAFNWEWMIYCAKAKKTGLCGREL